MWVDLVKVVGGIGGASVVGKTVETIIKANIKIPNEMKSKLILSAGAIIIADMVASKAYDHIGEQVDSAVMMYEKIKLEIAERKAKWQKSLMKN